MSEMLTLRHTYPVCFVDRKYKAVIKPLTDEEWAFEMQEGAAPKEWWGLSGPELQKVSGIETAIYVDQWGEHGSTKRRRDCVAMVKEILACGNN